MNRMANETKKIHPIVSEISSFHSVDKMLNGMNKKWIGSDELNDIKKHSNDGFLIKFNALWKAVISAKSRKKAQLADMLGIGALTYWLEYMEAKQKSNDAKLLLFSKQIEGLDDVVADIFIRYYVIWWRTTSSALLHRLLKEQQKIDKADQPITKNGIRILADIIFYLDPRILLEPFSYYSTTIESSEKEAADLYQTLGRFFVSLKQLNRGIKKFNQQVTKTKRFKENWKEFNFSQEKIREMLMRTREYLRTYAIDIPKIPYLKEGDLIRGTRGGMGHWQNPSTEIAYQTNPPPRTKGVDKAKDLKQIPKHFIQGPRGGYFYLGPNGTHRTYVSWWNYDNVPIFPSKAVARKYKRNERPIRNYIRDPESVRIRKNNMGNENSAEEDETRTRTPSRSPSHSRSPSRSRSASVTPSRSRSLSRSGSLQRPTSLPRMNSSRSNSPPPLDSEPVIFQESDSEELDSELNDDYDVIKPNNKRASSITLKEPSYKRGKWSQKPGFVPKKQPTRKVKKVRPPTPTKRIPFSARRIKK